MRQCSRLFSLSDVVFVPFVGVVGVSSVTEGVEEGKAVVVGDGAKLCSDRGFFVF